jgi:hypothetical protein
VHRICRRLLGVGVIRILRGSVGLGRGISIIKAFSPTRPVGRGRGKRRVYVGLRDTSLWWRDVSAQIVVAVRAREAIFKHTVVVANYCRKFGMKVKKSIYSWSKFMDKNEWVVDVPCLLMVSP